ncbi:hypothetical protein SAOR_01450 [Salinisphaera orenii MK-B5]|uniref:Uncharacterized protein n=1 Tax=Salinisphaera orenii MK-B5 TaxID=856730 RepID=A0A423PYD7_9GAMM|nr:hypothetical protein SAOR_01450 [Salinisphaera orenii MK-B5]
MYALGGIISNIFSFIFEVLTPERDERQLAIRRLAAA